MKNIIIVILICIIGIFIYLNNSQSNQEILDAKKELGVEVDTSSDGGLSNAKKEIFEQIDETIGDLQDVVSPNEIIEEEITINTENVTDNVFLELDTIYPDDLADGEVELTGKTLSSVDKIRVEYSNKDSDFPDDDFTLQQFSAGDDTFLYRAFLKYETFDFGENIYTFYAYSGDEISELQLIINNPKPIVVSEKPSENNTSSDSERIDIENLPVGSDFGTPTKLSESKITYSDVQGFELEKRNTTNISCEGSFVTPKVTEKTSSWSWWNTCRPLENEKGISVYVLNMDNGNYTYSKHYISNNHYATLELTSGVDTAWSELETVDAKNEWLKTKNNELKVTNDTFSISEITDTLFSNIIK